ncbi:FIG00031715: Predicted metal-dependent phosphoesterases (PHP family) [uncultured Gammaproteobacteria bacterium]|jgi:predicted metal-dependent phosphoesterase TrpH|uniref:PHP domain-containing protein n=1 Tax=thiotrophic endosymbiont of Bathymodiolus puteoserpentis (Logatchev) TaxID=343240 RepID=UPI0010BB4D34|nr:PHP domain-containing protein [thiotrophic endosymbiont of Bathymodiolus puteoserpentis (Logatchev)]CAC9490697.1 FIG00031715: Predicted metal-dependent phosphoesterases (PHP family) [uncultured Gammaproteobacteria bacterium]CAC9495372.1 FIG00031715: Predicted metal-dependent phosphoesterases (PHP family) [uncultured Gammaproteobacteria bacterium]CAC9628125.1 FIG00031715: Predicted metal-dependent phosphoesterases (PHP family) [uncultured Gammaproteobacteria bacterium]CAC9661635.1 FIG00031715
MFEIIVNIITLMTIDLHNHSYYSDGVLSPSEVVCLAKESGCNVFALTDHDTTDGLIEAQQEANNQNIKLVHGVEISAMWSKMTIHIVGLNIDKDNSILRSGLKQHQDFRKTRAEKIARSLGGAGVVGAMEKTQALAKTDMITRTHFAQMLIQEGICKDMKSVFRRFLTGKNPGGVGGKWAQFDEVIKWIHAAGGVAVLAHPLRYRMTNTKIQRMLSHLSNAGLDGVEVITAHSTDGEITLMSKWANEHELLHSCGSDYHGWNNQRIKIGCLKDFPNPDRALWRDW